ncbi:MAG: hypothetical protein ABUK20_14695 [Anaerolineales bacterium]
MCIFVEHIAANASRCELHMLKGGVHLLLIDQQSLIFETALPDLSEVAA